MPTTDLQRTGPTAEARRMLARALVSPQLAVMPNIGAMLRAFVPVLDELDRLTARVEELEKRGPGCV